MPAGEHRLAAAWRADHEDVVAAGRRDLERTLHVLLAAHVGEVGRVAVLGGAGAVARLGGSGCQRPWSRSAIRASVGIP